MSFWVILKLFHVLFIASVDHNVFANITLTLTLTLTKISTCCLHSEQVNEITPD